MAKGNPRPKYKWTKNSRDLRGDNIVRISNNVIVLRINNSSDLGTYVCAAKNILGVKMYRLRILLPNSPRGNFSSKKEDQENILIPATAIGISAGIVLILVVALMATCIKITKIKNVQFSNKLHRSRHDDPSEFVDIETVGACAAVISKEKQAKKPKTHSKNADTTSNKTSPEYSSYMNTQEFVLFPRPEDGQERSVNNNTNVRQVEEKKNQLTSVEFDPKATTLSISSVNTNAKKTKIRGNRNQPISLTAQTRQGIMQKVRYSVKTKENKGRVSEKKEENREYMYTDLLEAKLMESGKRDYVNMPRDETDGYMPLGPEVLQKPVEKLNV